MEKGQRGASISKLNNVLMQMRKNCNHPDLITSALDPSPKFPSAAELVEQCGKMQLLDRLLKPLKARGHKVLIFSQVRAPAAPRCFTCHSGQVFVPPLCWLPVGYILPLMAPTRTAALLKQQRSVMPGRPFATFVV